MHSTKLTLFILQCIWTVTALPVASLKNTFDSSSGRSSSCCFELEALLAETGIQVNLGSAVLGSTNLLFNEERYCLDGPSSQLVLAGEEGFMGSVGHRDASAGQVYKYASASGGCARQCFSIETSEDGKQFLAHDGVSKFGFGPQPTSSMHPTPEMGHDRVLARLLLKGQTRSCTSPAAGASPAAGPLGERDASQVGTQENEAIGPGVTTRIDSARSGESGLSATCSAMGGSPSIAPSKVFVGLADASVLDQSMDFEAAISPTQSTAFQFYIPNGWAVSPASSKCAVYFRLPYCTELPNGYPCYNFSGIEQEYVGNAGMLFYQIQNAPFLTQNLIQVTPGQNTLVGTFDCNAGGDMDPAGNGRLLSWLVKSQNMFLLQYLQPGGNIHVDSIGIWVVACNG